MSDEKLLPCSQCGKEPEIFKIPNRVEYIVGCNNFDCDLIWGDIKSKTEKEAIDKWNYRV